MRDVAGHARETVNLGRFAEARRLCDTIFRHDPGNLAALQIFASATPFAPDDPVFARLEDYARLRDIPDAARIQIHFMLGKALDDMGHPP